MTAPVETVTAYFGLSATGGNFFTLDDATKGVLDNTSYLLADVTVASDITAYVRSVEVRRGRNRQIDEFTVGVATIVLDNTTRAFDPLYSSSPYYGNVQVGKRVTLATDGVTTFDGLIDDINFGYDVSGDSIATLEVADCLAVLGAKQFDEWTATAGQNPGPRITSVLNRSEVAFGVSRSIGTGVATLQADTVAWGSNVLQYCQSVSRTELGQFFASAGGVLTFYGRDRTLTGVGAPEFRDDGTGTPYAGVGLDYGTELLFTRVSVDINSGTQQTVNDTAAQAEFGIRTLSQSGLLFDSDSQALDMANLLLVTYSNPAVRLASITVLAHGVTDGQRLTTLGLDIGSVIRVVYTPNRLGAHIDQYCLVEGVTHSIVPRVHSVTLQLSNLTSGFSGTPLILDDAVSGIVDTNVLAF